MRLFASLLLIIIPAETRHAQNYKLHVTLTPDPHQRCAPNEGGKETVSSANQQAWLYWISWCCWLLQMCSWWVPVILPVSERQGLAPCFISLSRRISWKNLPDSETWAGTRHTWSLLPMCCTRGRNKMLSVSCLFIDNCINFWEVCFLI